MAVYFKYKSAKDYDSIPMLDPFISVANLKLKIFESKRFGKGKDFDLIVTNAQTNDDYVDPHTLIPKNSSLLIRRVPGLPRLPIVIPSVTQPETYHQPHVGDQEKDHTVKVESIEVEYDDFGEDVYAVMPIVQDAPTNSIDGEESCKIKNLTVDTPECNDYGFGRGGMGWKKPPVGYVCHRCKVPGHFIQHCPTNGDPNYDIKKARPPTGIPKSMLMANPSGGGIGVLKPNEAAFAKEVEGLSYSSCSSSSSKRSFSDIPPELYCPLCRQVMKDAVIASKCCFSSFCDKCIRNHIISKSMCVCGVRNILADTLLPNMTLRASITRIVEARNSGSDHGVTAVMALTHGSLTNSKSAASEGDVLPPAPPQKEQTCRAEEILASCKTGTGNGRNSEPASHKRNAPLTVEEVHEKPIAGEAGKMKKRKIASFPSDAAAAAAYLPSWTGMQYMNYGHNHVLPQEAFGGQGFMSPYGPLPQGDLADIYLPRHSFGRQHSEARTASLKRKRELSRDQFLVL